MCNFVSHLTAYTEVDKEKERERERESHVRRKPIFNSRQQYNVQKRTITKTMTHQIDMISWDESEKNCFFFFFFFSPVVDRAKKQEQEHEHEERKNKQKEKYRLSPKTIKHDDLDASITTIGTQTCF
jgi:hypothetical protein